MKLIWRAYINKLETIDWDQGLEPLDVKQALENFTDNFTNFVNSTILLRTMHPKSPQYKFQRFKLKEALGEARVVTNVALCFALSVHAILVTWLSPRAAYFIQTGGSALSNT